MRLVPGIAGRRPALCHAGQRPAVPGLLLAFVITSVTYALAAEPPLPPVERAAIVAELTTQLADLDRALAKSPRDVALRSRHGDCQLFLANFRGAVADFEQMIALDPAQDAPHWRLGIAYYFAGEFAKSARQFEKYHAYDGRDRENGVWKFLGDVKVLGLEPARRAMLVYSGFDREPFPALYALLAGKTSTDAFFADLEARGLDENSRVMFFANYYAGLHEEILGHHDRAIELVSEAVANPWGRSGRGADYMWQVARVHYEALTTARGPARESRVP